MPSGGYRPGAGRPRKNPIDKKLEGKPTFSKVAPYKDHRCTRCGAKKDCARKIVFSKLRRNKCSKNHIEKQPCYGVPSELINTCVGIT